MRIERVLVKEIHVIYLAMKKSQKVEFSTYSETFKWLLRHLWV